MRRILTLEDWFGRLMAVLGAVFGLIIAAIALSVTLDIAMRNLRMGNIPWLNEVAEYALFYGTFLAVPWVLRLGAHVRVDILVSSIPKRAGLRLEQFVDVIGFAISVVLCWFGTVSIRDAVMSGAKQYKQITVSEWFLLLPFAFAMLLLAIEFLFRLSRAREVMAREESAIEQSGF